MIVNQTLLYSIFNNTNNIRFKLCKNSFNAVWKKAAQGSPLSPTRAIYVIIMIHSNINIWRVGELNAVAEASLKTVWVTLGQVSHKGWQRE